jgi:NAD+ kinase
MQIALYGRMMDDEQGEHLLRLVSLLRSHDVDLVFHSGLKTWNSELKMLIDSPLFFSSGSELEGCDLLISVGGDGTLLDTITVVRDSGLAFWLM